MNNIILGIVDILYAVMLVKMTYEYYVGAYAGDKNYQKKSVMGSIILYVIIGIYNVISSFYLTGMFFRILTMFIGMLVIISAVVVYFKCYREK